MVFMNLGTPINELRGVGGQIAKKLQHLGIVEVGDLLWSYPRRYDDYSKVTKIDRLRPGIVTINARFIQVSGRYVRRGMHITEAVASDDSGSVRIIWFNQPYRINSVKKHEDYYISGNFELNHQRLSIISPSIELASDFPLNTARIVPIYRETKGVNSLLRRKLLNQVVPLIHDLPENLPNWVIQENRLMQRHEAVLQMHFPADTASLDKAKNRLGFEEVFCLSLASLLNKYELTAQHAPPVPFDQTIAQNFVRHLPFSLTNAQRKVTWQIYKDMQKSQPMNRLIEGDVGSGKTAVAAMAALMVLHDGHQVAYMAPTELLATQHAANLFKMLTPLGYGQLVGLLTGSMTAAQKKTAYEKIAAGDIKFIIGTHALIQEKVDMHSLELIIIDEQHRFGVEQRKTLQKKAGHMPHVLSLTATPIPRSLALTLYGDLDVSLLDEKPAERKTIKTKIVSPNSRAQLNKSIDANIAKGEQVFVVCPTISSQIPVVNFRSSDDAQETVDNSSQSAANVYERLSKKEFKHRRVGLLHGKMKSDDKNATMQKFINHELDILVATTVIEVGVDVPNATIMVIESAERFGLAQLHQLRGRVGRSDKQGYCYLMMSDSSAPPRRLRALESSNDGFRLAELDLELRGPGAIYGSMQHGQLDLRIADLSDMRLISAARRSAQSYIDKQEDLLKYPELNRHITRLRAITNLN